MEIRNFEIRAYVTGFTDSEVVLKGIFEWGFDAQRHHLRAHEAREFDFSRDQFLTNTGNLYRFYVDVDDLTQIGHEEGPVGESMRLRDTAHIIVKLMSKHNDGAGMVNTELGRAVLREAGNAYYEPPLP